MKRQKSKKRTIHPSLLQGLLTICFVLIPFLPALAEESRGKFKREHYRIPRVHSQFKIDGVLDEEAWQHAALLELKYETKPGENIPARNRTDCLLAYDEINLYIAFRAFDPNPKEIWAHYTDRDQAFSDDFVGVALDTFHDERRAFEFFVNPLGVQMDMFNDDVAREEDASWDAIWFSAAKITAEGYNVEMMIPFRSLRFPDTPGEQTWGIDALRYHSRDQRYRYGLNRQDRDISCYLCQTAHLQGFEGISSGRNLEFDPTFTSSMDEQMSEFPDGEFAEDWTGDPGVTMSWGVTPNWNLNATINPDFSQVEADAAQLDINTQFALFFPEKRPFFLEGADFFTTPFEIVFTRNVADPIFGSKFSGKSGKNVAAAFFAQDEITNILIPGSQESFSTSFDESTSDTVLRYRTDVGEKSTVGVLVTDRESQDYYNRVIGADGTFKPGDSDTIRFQLLGSQTQYPEFLATNFNQPQGSFEDYGIHLGHLHESRDWLAYTRYQSLGRDFRGDMGFLPQVDMRLVLAGGGHNWWGDDSDWFTRIHLGGDFDNTTDQEGNLIEREAELFFELNGPMQSYFFVGPGVRKRVFNDVSFDQTYINAFMEMSPSGSLYFSLDTTFGDQLDFENTRNGKITLLAPGMRYRFGKHLQINLNHRFQKLDVEGDNLFIANLTETRITYQFNIRTFIRFISQYTDIDRNEELYLEPVNPKTQVLFNQVLFSYKINPQTVLFLGYSDNHFGEYGIDLTQTDRTVFFKVGYAWRL